jgi:hypothetical protein
MKNATFYMVLRGRRVVEWVRGPRGSDQSTLRTPMGMLATSQQFINKTQAKRMAMALSVFFF